MKTTLLPCVLFFAFACGSDPLLLPAQGDRSTVAPADPHRLNPPPRESLSIPGEILRYEAEDDPESADSFGGHAARELAANEKLEFAWILGKLPASGAIEWRPSSVGVAQDLLSYGSYTIRINPKTRSYDVATPLGTASGESGVLLGGPQLLYWEDDGARVRFWVQNTLRGDWKPLPRTSVNPDTLVIAAQGEIRRITLWDRPLTDLERDEVAREVLADDVPVGGLVTRDGVWTVGQSGTRPYRGLSAMLAGDLVTDYRMDGFLRRSPTSTNDGTRAIVGRWELGEFGGLAQLTADEIAYATGKEVAFLNTGFGATGAELWTPGGALWDAAIKMAIRYKESGVTWRAGMIAQGEEDSKTKGAADAWLARWQASIDDARARVNPNMIWTVRQFWPTNPNPAVYKHLDQMKANVIALAASRPNVYVITQDDLDLYDGVHKNETGLRREARANAEIIQQ